MLDVWSMFGQKNNLRGDACSYMHILNGKMSQELRFNAVQWRNAGQKILNAGVMSQSEWK